MSCFALRLTPPVHTQRRILHARPAAIWGSRVSSACGHTTVRLCKRAGSGNEQRVAHGAGMGPGGALHAPTGPARGLDAQEGTAVANATSAAEPDLPLHQLVGGEPRVGDDGGPPHRSARVCCHVHPLSRRSPPLPLQNCPAQRGRSPAPTSPDAALGEGTGLPSLPAQSTGHLPSERGEKGQTEGTLVLVGQIKHTTQLTIQRFVLCFILLSPNNKAIWGLHNLRYFVHTHKNGSFSQGIIFKLVFMRVLHKGFICKGPKIGGWGARTLLAAGPSICQSHKTQFYYSQTRSKNILFLMLLV